MGTESITPKAANINYILLVVLTTLIAVGAIAYELFLGRTVSDLDSTVLPILLLSCLTMIAASMAVEFSPRVVITIVNIPILLAIIFTGPIGAAIVASVGAFWVARTWELPAIVFNVTALLIASLVGAELFIRLSDYFEITTSMVTFEFIGIALISGLAFLVLNITFISAYTYAKYPGSLGELWKQNFIPAIPSQLALMGLGLVVAAIYVKGGLIAATLFFIPLFASQHVFRLLIQQKELLAEQTTMSEDLMDMNIGLAGALIMLLDSKDHYTASHSAGVAMYCRDMARMMGMSEDEQRIAHMAGLLHDLGKVGTPDSVLKKEGELTAREWEQIKEHPTTAAEVLSQLATHQEIADIIRHHQEHFDGTGYPYGISGNDIPELSRMLAVADTYHALTSDRPYRAAKSPFEALIILRRVAGTQLDPKYVEVMAQVLKNEDLSYREGSKADFLSEFRKGRPALRLDALRARAKEH